MPDLKISEMLEMQRELCERYKGKWELTEPKNAHYAILWMIEELGEAIAIIKKRGADAIMADPELRKDFIEELSDVLMYFTKILLCYNIDYNEISEIFTSKHNHNMNRDFIGEHSSFRK